MTTDTTCIEDVFEALKYRVVVTANGTRRYYNGAGQVHRDEGPAVEWWDGAQEWYQNGRLHRTNGPAAVYPDGDKHWFQNGLRHRTYGPAIEWHAGVCEWWLQGVRYTEADYYAALKGMGIQNDH